MILVNTNKMADTSKEKEIFKKFLPGNLISLFRKIVYPEKILFLEDDLRSLFLTHYQQVAASDLNQRTAIRNAEFKIFSKYGEDGILLYIFSKIGLTNRAFIEIGVEDGRECNTANLSLNFGWQGMLVDAGKEGLEKARHFYQEKLGNNASKVKIVHCFVTAENINQLILDNGIQGEIDLLSIDIDGNDYWVWKAISVINPRAVVVEYNASLGSDKSVAIKYDSNFRENSLYHGASLEAFKKLADSKGYLLVGCDSHGIDAFFVRKDVVQGKFAELSVREAYYPHSQRLKDIGSTEKQFEQIKHLDFDHV